MIRDEITLFQENRPDAPAYDPRAKAQAYAKLMAAAQGTERAPRRRVNRRWLLVAGAAGTAVAAVAVGLGVPQGGGDTGTPAPGRKVMITPVANAEDLAGNAARTAAAGPDDRARPGQWSYAKTVLADSSKGSGGALSGPPDRRATREVWKSPDGRTAYPREGRMHYERPNPNSSPPDDYAYLLALPTDTEALRARLYQVVDKEEKMAADARNERAFDIIEAWMRNTALPARLRAAMYGVLAKIPGVKYEAKAADILGRPGVTLYRIVEGYVRSEIMIDARTYGYLGFRSIAVRDHLSKNPNDVQAKKGQIMGWGGLVKTAIVNAPGDRP